MKLIAFTFCLFTFVTSISMAGGKSVKLPDLKTVEQVDLPRFMGPWYIIGSIPTIFEKDAVNAIETYSWNDRKNRIDVDFRYRKKTPAGKEEVIPQKAFIHNKTTNAEWRIQFFWPLKFSYLILDIAPDYSDTIIGVPGRGNLWIMAREPKLSDERYAQLIEKAKFMGFDIEKIKKVPQIWTEQTLQK
jgi:apolipoprotein D and lipocalin family protein